MARSLVRLATLAAGILAALVAWSQEDVLENPEFVAAMELVQQSQEAFIRDELRLTADEAAVFWPLYSEYRADTLPIRNRYILLIADYVRQYETGVLSDDYAAGMIDGYFEVRQALLDVRKRYVERFAAVLPMLKVARFYQLENKMTADVEAELALLVPLVEAE